MSFTFVCKFCNQRLEAEDSWAGMEVPCPSCKKNIVIPSNNADNHEQNGKSRAPNIMGEFLHLTRFSEWPLHIDGCLKIDHPLLAESNAPTKADAEKLAKLIYQIPLHTQDGRVWTLCDIIDNADVKDSGNEVTLSITPDNPQVSKLPKSIKFLIFAPPEGGKTIRVKEHGVICAFVVNEWGEKILDNNGVPEMIHIDSPFLTNSTVKKVMCHEDQIVGFNEPLCILASMDDDLIYNTNFQEVQGLLVACLRFPVESSVWNDGIKLLNKCYKLYSQQISPFLLSSLLLRSNNNERKKQYIDHLYMLMKDGNWPAGTQSFAGALLGKYLMNEMNDEKGGKQLIIQAKQILDEINKNMLTIWKAAGKTHSFKGITENNLPFFTEEEQYLFNNLPVFFDNVLNNKSKPGNNTIKPSNKRPPYAKTTNKTPNSSDTGDASFNVYLTEMGDKIETIKAIREFLNCGLKEAKDFADSNLPVCILENADGTRSNDFKMKLEAIGAGVNICAVGSAEDRMIHKGIYMPSASPADKQEDNGGLGTKLGVGCLIVAIVVAVWTLFGEKGFLTTCAIGIAAGVAFRKK